MIIGIAQMRRENPVEFRLLSSRSYSDLELGEGLRQKSFESKHSALLGIVFF